MKQKVMIRAVLAALLAFTLTALVSCGGGGGSGSQGSKGEITIGSKNFTEQVILGELYSQKLEAEGYKVNKKLDLGNVTVLDKALQSGEIDMYPEYTGTALVTALGYEGKKFDTPQGTYDKTKELYEKRDPAATLLKQASFNNTYGIAVRKDVADKYGLKTLEDLAKTSPRPRQNSYSPPFPNSSNARMASLTSRNPTRAPTSKTSRSSTTSACATRRSSRATRTSPSASPPTDSSARTI